MKKLLLTILISMSMMTSFAKTVYCVMHLEFDSFQKGYAIMVNYGSETQRETSPEGSSLYVVKNNVEALNKLAGRGWVYVDTYVENNKRYYILKREVPD